MNSMINHNNMQMEFLKFYKQLRQSGQSPEQILNDLISSGKITKEQLEDTVKRARGLSFLLQYIN